jgi:hypothetical protein
MDERVGKKLTLQELMSALGDDASGRSQMKIWLQNFKRSHPSCSDLPPAEAYPSASGCSLRHFFKKCPVGKAWLIDEPFHTIILTEKYTVRENWERRVLRLVTDHQSHIGHNSPPACSDRGNVRQLHHATIKHKASTIMEAVNTRPHDAAFNCLRHPEVAHRSTGRSAISYFELGK